MNDNNPIPDADIRRTGDKMLGAVLDRMNQQEARTERWRNIRFFSIAGFFIIGFLVYWGVIYSAFTPSNIKGDYVAMVRVQGVIDDKGAASAIKIIPALEKAFKAANEEEAAKGVIIHINSPGGSPVQSSLIHDRLLELGKKYPDVNYVAVGEDAVTSGAYYIATGAPEIYVNRSTITGSIGVISSNFGLSDVIKKVGVQRRVYTAGQNKAFLDMYLPESQKDRERMDQMLNAMHNHFIDSVKTTRKDKIKIDETMAFSGAFWTGDTAYEYGLVDGLSSLSQVMTDKFDVEQFVDMTPKPGIFEKFGNSIGVSIANNLPESVIKALTHEGLDIR